MGNYAMSTISAPVMNTDELCPVFLKLPPQEIVFIRGILESYEGVAEVRTLNADTGIIVALALIDTAEDVRAIIADVAANGLDIREIPPPAEVKGDWLLEEYFLDLETR